MSEIAPTTIKDYASWREWALRALSQGLPPEAVPWDAGGEASTSTPGQLSLGMDAAPAVAASHSGAAIQAVRISRELAALLRDAAQHRAAQRWAFLYRVLWRWAQGDRAVASAADEDGARLYAMAKAVRRAQHDMIAYVRFQERRPDMRVGAGDDLPQYLAWYEPDHDVLAYAAGHFARRMGEATWWIGTPDGAATWDGREVRYSAAPPDPGAFRAGADQIEPLWMAYYKNIFNPARLNEAALHQHMPVRFWKGLPEAALIPAMIADARNGAQRVGQAATVGSMRGKQVAVDAAQALPVRPVPTSLDQCRRCDLWRHATQAVPGRGPDTAPIMVVGEQPGDQEDLSGEPFVGPAGQVLDAALRGVGVSRDSLYLTNAVKHFKWMARGKRRMHKTPGQREVEACAHWLDEELARVRPRVIVTLGATALGAVVRQKIRLADAMAAPMRLGDTWIVATWHPSYALRVEGWEARANVEAAIQSALIQAHRLAEEETFPVISASE
ncbi:UdgX family uracil-DNA binding protein [Cupriavidus sp. 2SB]|uniref:UdgX family uracil-DNA binding protein n=1 Tax=Cupriavidus sp. 2SB TaxID=2502199 RepID=UPI001485853A|nr:UdgX family uracil-DNA binding protein [Cupriavidus sp. 2SB]